MDKQNHGTFVQRGMRMGGVKWGVSFLESFQKGLHVESGLVSDSGGAREPPYSTLAIDGFPLARGGANLFCHA